MSDDPKQPEQPDLDALLNELGAVSGTPITKPPTKVSKKSKALPAIPEKKPEVPEPPKPIVNQNDIDELLTDLAANKPSAGTPKPTSTKPPSTRLVPTQDTNPDKKTPTSNKIARELSTSHQPLTRRQQMLASVNRSGELDNVLDQLEGGAGTAARAAAITPAQLGLSQSDLDDLVAKHNATKDPGSESRKEVMISQDDINSLVGQLAQVTGGEPEQVTDIISKHTKTIDGLMAKADGDPRKETSVDALAATVLSESKRQAKPPTRHGAAVGATMATAMMDMPMVPGMAVATTDLRGTRYLLAAAVVLLALCAGTLAMMIQAITGLSHELHQDKIANAIPETGDDYAVALKAALDYLQSDEETESAKGIVSLEKIKSRFPGHELDIGLIVAKHFRSHANHRRAVTAYTGIIDHVGNDDPRIYLDYADSLEQAHDIGTAIRMVYSVLAKEAQYLDNHDSKGSTRSAEDIARNTLAIQQAYLVLGRLLAEEGDPETPKPAKVDTEKATTEEVKVVSGHGSGHH